jgi:hypothetical protein
LSLLVSSFVLLSYVGQEPLSSMGQQLLPSAGQQTLSSVGQQTLSSMGQQLLSSMGQQPLSSVGQQPLSSVGQHRCPLWLRFYLIGWFDLWLGFGLSSGDNLGQCCEATIWVMWFVWQPSILSPLKN